MSKLLGPQDLVANARPAPGGIANGLGLITEDVGSVRFIDYASKFPATVAEYRPFNFYSGNVYWGAYCEKDGRTGSTVCPAQLPPERPRYPSKAGVLFLYNQLSATVFNRRARCWIQRVFARFASTATTPQRGPMFN